MSRQKQRSNQGRHQRFNRGNTNAIVARSMATLKKTTGTNTNQNVPQRRNCKNVGHVEERCCVKTKDQANFYEKQDVGEK